MKSASTLPWTLSGEMIRCQYFQPLASSLVLVADGAMVGIWASAKLASTAWDSPESAGPMSPSALSWITFWAWPGATVGSPLVSYFFRTSFTVGLVALYWSMASW